jgi:hypothetical protein
MLVRVQIEMLAATVLRTTLRASFRGHDLRSLARAVASQPFTRGWALLSCANLPRDCLRSLAAGSTSKTFNYVP